MAKQTILTLCLVAALASSPVVVIAADPPGVGELALLNAKVPLRLADERVIGAYIDHWLGQLKAAKKFDAMEAARKKLAVGYEAQESSYYRVSYAKIAAEKVPAALAWPEKSKQILAARALSRMSQYSIQPALEKMAASKNAGVRYWAIRGYQRAARAVMTDRGRTAKMVATLERLGLSEPSGIVVSAVFSALRPNVGKAELAKLRKPLLTVWRARTKDVMAGDLDMIYAYSVELKDLSPLDAADRETVLQLLADVLKAGEVALGAEAGVEKTPALLSLSHLLINAENRLGETLNLAQTPIYTALRGGGKKLLIVRLVDALDGVGEWLTLLKKNHKVKPNIPKPPKKAAAPPAPKNK